MLRGLAYAVAVPERPADRLPYGEASQRVLDALESPTSVAGVALHLGWDHDRARSWVHRLKGMGRVIRVGWEKCHRGQAAGTYQRKEQIP